MSRELEKTNNLKTVVFAMFGKHEFNVFTQVYEQWKQQQQQQRGRDL